ISLTYALKNNRLTKDLPYNEAAVLFYLYKSFKAGEGLYLQDILKRNKMHKSLANRTVNSLIKKGMIYTERDGNKLILHFCAEKESEYLGLHEKVLKLVGGVINILGNEDSLAFIRICDKICKEV
ncbi:MAG: MarR family transcriptional regulator, partial [Clostridia bacterium]|nr:MarR family transcriptional regulator [Clostridia bacterium]